MDASEIYMQNKIELVSVIRTIFMILMTYISNYKLQNRKIEIDFIEIIKIILVIIITVFCEFAKYQINYFISIISTILVISAMFSKNNIGKSIITTIMSLSMNYIISAISIILCFIINKIFCINNDYISLIIIMVFHIFILSIIFIIKRFKYGISFLKNENVNEYIDIYILNICAIILFSIIILVDSNIKIAMDMGIGLFVFSIITFITIQKSLQLYYKQKLLVQELEQTKKDLADKTKEIEILEKENITISKRNHTIDHKQKSLELKMAEMMNKSEISKEEVAEVRERLKQISKDINREKIATELDKTEISEIDDMLKYMQIECNKNNIEFELQIKGNIHYMTNNLISKEDLETLLADHIKNAIIAIEHTDNINKSILVRLGKIDENYGLYIYDSGIEFEQETLKNLGKKPSTTHANEGGTGMGFMNTFDTLNKCKASLIIEEFNKPSKDNYTKALCIKFDNKSEFKIKSYR